VQPTQEHILNYETKWITRRKLADATYAAVAALQGEISRFSISTACDKRELFWPRRVFNCKFAEITHMVGRYFAGSTRHW